MKNCGIDGEAYSKTGTSKDHVISDTLPARHRSLSEFILIELQTMTGLALFVTFFGSYLRIIFFTLFPHGPHRGQHIPGNG